MFLDTIVSEFGLIPSYGGGVEDPPPVDPPVVDPPPVDPPADPPPSDPPPVDPPAVDPEVAQLRADNEKLAADKKVLEDEKEAQRVAELSELEKEKDLRVKAEEKAAENERIANERTIEAAVNAKLADMAGKGEALEPEFVPAITDIEKIGETFEAALVRQQEVKEKWNSSAPNLPHGGQGREGKTGSVPQADIVKFKEAREQMLHGTRTKAVERKFHAGRRQLIAAGLDPQTV